MQSQFSLKSLSVAILMFAVTVAMHEASRVDRFASQRLTPVLTKLFDFADLLPGLY